jgi:DNA polymerase-3 subunit delta
MPVLKHSELERDLKSEIRPVYLIHGDESLLVEDAWGRVSRKALGNAMAQFNEELFRARENTAADVLASCHTLPVMADRRVVLVREINFWKAGEQAGLLPYVEAPNPSTCLILVSQEKLDGRSKLVAAVRKSGVVIEARHPYGRELMQRVHGLAKDTGKKLDQDAADLLLDLAGKDLQGLKMQVEKLALYVGDRQRITREDVSEAVADVKLFTIFEFTDALGNKNLEAALRSFNRMLELGEAPVMILSMVTRHFRILFQMMEDRKRGLPVEETAKSFRLPPNIMKNNYLPQSRKFKMNELARMWKAFADMDYRLKSSSSSRELMFEQMIIELCRA